MGKYRNIIIQNSMQLFKVINLGKISFCFLIWYLLFKIIKLVFFINLNISTIITDILASILNILAIIFLVKLNSKQLID